MKARTIPEPPRPGPGRQLGPAHPNGSTARRRDISDGTRLALDPRAQTLERQRADAAFLDQSWDEAPDLEGSRSSVPARAGHRHGDVETRFGRRAFGRHRVRLGRGTGRPVGTCRRRGGRVGARRRTFRGLLTAAGHRWRRARGGRGGCRHGIAVRTTTRCGKREGQRAQRADDDALSHEPFPLPGAGITVSTRTVRRPNGGSGGMPPCVAALTEYL